MYSTAKKMSTISAICCAANIMGLILFVLISASLNLTFAANFAILMFMITGAATNFAVTLGLRSLCQDLDYEYENTTIKFKEINEKIEVLEQKR